MSIEVERLCHGVFALYQQDEEGVQSVIVTSEEVTALAEQIKKTPPPVPVRGAVEAIE